MNRLRWLGTPLVFALVTAAAAGSAPARLACRSQRAPIVTLAGWIPADEIVLDMKLTRGPSARLLQFEQGDTPYVIEDFRNQVFSMVVAFKDGSRLTLYAIPASVKAAIGGKGTRASFQAILTTPKPEHVGYVMAKDMIWDLPMSCTYDYKAP
jgi:hypothetical protein